MTVFPPLLKKELPPWGPRSFDVLVNVIDEIAAKRPSSSFAYYPVLPASYTAGYRCITYGNLANIVNGLAWWIINNFGPAKNFETIAYVGPNDVRYNAFTLAAVKAGYKMFFTSPRNSTAAHASLFKATDSKALVTPNPNLPMAVAIANAGGVELVQSPSLDELLNQEHPKFSYGKDFEQARTEHFVVLHTSGTTGIPKPLIWTHGSCSAVWEMTQLQAPDGYEIAERYLVGKKLFVTLPPFHAAGLSWTLLFPVFTQVAAVLPVQGALPTVQLVADGLKATCVDCALLAPPMIEELNQEPELLNFFGDNLEFLFFAGGDISKKHGDFVNSRLPCFPAYAGTDIGLPPQLRTTGPWRSEDWKYIKFHPAAGLKFCHVNDDIYEVVIARNAKETKVQFVFTILPELMEYRNGDLFSPHPEIPNLWQYRGRNDDIVVFLTGEKTNPVTMEQHIARHSEIKAALVVGTQRFQAALILELANSGKELNAVERAAMIERVWPYIEEANQECPNFAKILKSLILVAPPQKPFMRAGKGTVQRRATLELFGNEIDALYRDYDKIVATNFPADDETLRLSLVSDAAALMAFVRNTVLEVTSWAAVENTTNLFLFGMDSLQTLMLTQRFRSVLKLTELTPGTIYSNPTINGLLDILTAILIAEEKSTTGEVEQRHQTLQETIVSHKAFIDQITSSFRKSEPGLNTIATSLKNSENFFVLTGSTGSIGSYLLGSLLSNTSVSHIFCLNRSQESASIQQTRNTLRHLTYSLDNRRVSFLNADLTKPNLGLPESTYRQLLQSTTHIIHNAWPVNFNLSLDAFGPSLAGVKGLIQFAASASQSPQLLFVSSIATTVNLLQSVIPETVIPSYSAPPESGYAASKYIAEQVLDYASAKLSSPIRIARVGQVAGPINSPGAWNKNEWFPSLVISSVAVGAVPETLGSMSIDWVPIDVLADVLHEITIFEQREPANTTRGAVVMQPVNSHVVSWQSLLPSVRRVLDTKARKPLQVVTLREWIGKVRTEAEKTRDDKNNETKFEARRVARMLQRNPAAKLLDWFEALLERSVEDEVKKWENAAAVKASKALGKLGPVSEQWITAWVERCFD